MMPDADAVADADRSARVEMEGRVERATFPDDEISHDVAVPPKLKLAEDARAPSDPYSGQPVTCCPQPTERLSRKERDQQLDE